MTVAVMGCVVNGPGESKHANIGISLPGTGERPVAPVYEDGAKTVTLKGDQIAEEFQELVERDDDAWRTFCAQGTAVKRPAQGEGLTERRCKPCERACLRCRPAKRNRPCSSSRATGSWSRRARRFGANSRSAISIAPLASSTRWLISPISKTITPISKSATTIAACAIRRMRSGA